MLKTGMWKDYRIPDIKASLIVRLKHTEEYSFLKDADSTSLQSAAKNADKAYKNMFNKRA